MIKKDYIASSATEVKSAKMMVEDESLRPWQIHLQTKEVNSVVYNQQITWSDEQLKFSTTSILDTFLGE